MLLENTDQASTPTILLVDDEPDFLHGLARAVARDSKCSVLTAKSGQEGLDILDRTDVDLILTDVRMPDMDGIEMLEKVKRRHPGITIIMMTAYATIDTAVEAIKKGAYDFIQKPFKPKDITQLIDRAFERNRLIRENRSLKDQLQTFQQPDPFVSTGPGLQRMMSIIQTIAALDVTVLIRGETGSGKDVAARKIHSLSPRNKGQMITVNCPAIPENLLESELFGYTRGAFTGAVANKKGLIQQAGGGTIFLDEIADISMPVQAKLLRLIQDKEVRPLGITQSQIVDVRILASTNRNLEAKIIDNSFREDLFYRLNVVTITMPSLRDIPEDIPHLARHFIQQASREFSMPPKQISNNAMEFLVNSKWPGNIRQLRNSIQKALIFSTGSEFQIADFQNSIERNTLDPMLTDSSSMPYKTAREKVLRDFTVDYVTRALRKHEGNITAAARECGIERQHLQKILRKYHLGSKSSE